MALFVLGTLAIPVIAEKGEDIQVIFEHYPKKEKIKDVRPEAGAKGYYDLMGAKWATLPISLEMNTANCGCDPNMVVTQVHYAMNEWDDGWNSQDAGYSWRGISQNLFSGGLLLVTKGYNDLSWDMFHRDNCNTIIWGNYPKADVIAVTIVWYLKFGKGMGTIQEFDMVLDTDFPWGNAAIDPSKMDINAIVSHELGHGIGLLDLYNVKASMETMYGYSAIGELIKRTLYVGDQNGIIKIYGA